MAIQQSFNELALFAGAGGGLLASKILGWRTVCAVERDAYAAQVLAQRQNDGSLEPFPIWSDVTTFDGKPWRGIIDIISGRFPCQDLSFAGKGAGIEGKRSGLWSEMVRVIGEVQPRYAFVENVSALLTRGLGTVLGDLAEIGLDAEWGCLSAAGVGADHKRERIWILAHPVNYRYKEIRRRDGAATEEEGAAREQRSSSGRFVRTNEMEWNRSSDRVHNEENGESGAVPENTKFVPDREELIRRDRKQRGKELWGTEPDVDRVVDGMAFRMDRIKAVGNGQVPLCAAEAFRQLIERINRQHVKSMK